MQRNQQNDIHVLGPITEQWWLSQAKSILPTVEKNKNPLGIDFLKDGKPWLELKSEVGFNYWHGPNAAIEEFSAIENKSPGGPWQAQQKGGIFYWHQFLELRNPLNQSLLHGVFLTDVDSFVVWMNENKHKYRLVPTLEINEHGTTMCRLVPKIDLLRSGLCLRPSWAKQIVANLGLDDKIFIG